MVIYASVITLLTVAVILFETMPMILRWLNRIHIGRWENTELWKAAVKKRLIKQLRKPPRTPGTDCERLRIFSLLKHKQAPKHLQAWQHAALLLAASEFGDELCSEAAGLVSKTGVWDAQADSPAVRNRPENAMLAFAAMAFPVADTDKKDAAVRQLAQAMTDLAGEDETVPYNPALPHIRFVDTVGMICPFLFRYAYEYGQESAAALALRQMEEYFEYGMHPLLGLPVHCFDVNTAAPLGIYGWGRGCGWLAEGLMDSYQTALKFAQTPCDIADASPVAPKAVCETLLPLMRRLADAVGRFQMDNGGWDRQLPLRQTGEASATAMLRWYMTRMHTITGEEKYKTAAQKAQDYLMTCTRKNGSVDFAQGDTPGIGFYSAKSDILPASQGFTVRGNR